MSVDTMPTGHQPEGFISKSDVARRTGKTIRTVDNWMKRGILPYFKIRHSVLFKWSDVEAHLAANYRVARRTTLAESRH